MQLLKGINLFLSALPFQSIVHNQISSLENLFVHGDSVQAHNNQVWIEFSNIKDTCTSKDYPKISISIRKSTKPRHIQTCLAIFSSRFCAIELFIDFISLTCIYLVTGKFSQSDSLLVACMGWSSQRDVFSQNVTNRQLKARHAKSVNKSTNRNSISEKLSESYKQAVDQNWSRMAKDFGSKKKEHLLTLTMVWSWPEKVVQRKKYPFPK